MLRLSLALSSLIVLLISTAAYSQSLANLNRSPTETSSLDSNARAIAALKRLDQDVIVYRSLADFEDGRKLSLVSLITFERHLSEVCAEMTPLLDELPASKLKNQLTNALDAYRDGLFWWRQADEPRVVNVASLSYAARDRTPADAAFHATMPYTVAIHWRQAHDYLVRAERTLAR